MHMKISLETLFCLCIFPVIGLLSCGQSSESNQVERDKMMREFQTKNVYQTIEQYGEHLVTISACSDCHTPKKTGSPGMVFDSTRMLSGHVASVPVFEINRAEIQKKGLVVTNDLTTWVGPWGVSFSANLTPDETGIGSWNVDQFKRAIRFGKFHGQENGRNLLPPMPWEMYRKMSDKELEAVFAYLKSLPPIDNLVPSPLPPAK